MKDLQGFWEKCKVVLEESEDPNTFFKCHVHGSGHSVSQQSRFSTSGYVDSIQVH